MRRAALDVTFNTFSRVVQVSITSLDLFDKCYFPFPAAALTWLIIQTEKHKTAYVALSLPLPAKNCWLELPAKTDASMFGGEKQTYVLFKVNRGLNQRSWEVNFTQRHLPAFWVGPQRIGGYLIYGYIDASLLLLLFTTSNLLAKQMVFYVEIWFSGNCIIVF